MLLFVLSSLLSRVCYIHCQLFACIADGPDGGYKRFSIWSFHYTFWLLTCWSIINFVCSEISAIEV